jgi:hypothetical protein
LFVAVNAEVHACAVKKSRQLSQCVKKVVHVEMLNVCRVGVEGDSKGDSNHESIGLATPTG